jgi:signal peptidase I
LAKKKRGVLREWIQAIFIALIAVLIIRTFVVEAFMVPTPSMEQTLLIGDFVIVNKVSYGARTLRTPLTFPFAHQSMPFFKNVQGFINAGILPYFRLPGLGKIKHNDVVVFNYPMDDEYPVDHRIHYIKRCVGIPGDTIIIKNSQPYINQQQLESPVGLQFNYSVKTNSEDPDFFKNQSFSIGGRHNSPYEFRLPLDGEMVKQLKKDPQVVSIKNVFDVPGAYQDFIFPYNHWLPWNSDHFGPLVVPEKGKSIKLSAMNIGLYKRIIEHYEGNDFVEKDGVFYINNEAVDYYTFEMNYYFMMGDNRHYSADSRFWGFVPEDHILGKASMVLFSLKPQEKSINKIRWNRFFTLL